MPLSVLITLGLFGLVLMLWGQARSRAAQGGTDPDAATLEALARAGSDLSQPHEMEFFLYVPDPAAANAVADQLRPEGFHVQVTTEEGTGDWLCLATKVMTPALDELHRLRRYLSAVVESRGGAYDGWGATVVDTRADG